MNFFIVQFVLMIRHDFKMPLHMVFRMGGTNMKGIYDQDTFYPQFRKDVENARSLVLIQSPFLSVRRIRSLYSSLKKCVSRGVRVCVFSQKPFKRSEVFDAAADLLKSLGIHLNLIPNIHEKLVIVDEHIFWDGSLNVLSQNISKERMTRWESMEMVHDAAFRHNLMTCASCVVTPIGMLVRHRRNMMGITQKELASKTGLTQSIISQFESSKRDIQLSTLKRICRVTFLELRCLPWFEVMDDRTE